jgi:hypothetical protein
MNSLTQALHYNSDKTTDYTAQHSARTAQHSTVPHVLHCTVLYRTYCTVQQYRSVLDGSLVLVVIAA